MKLALSTTNASSFTPAPGGGVGAAEVHAASCSANAATSRRARAICGILRRGPLLGGKVDGAAGA